jgi:hypothetical protein
MQKYQDQLVQYVGDVQTKKHIKPQNFVEHHIVLTSHDETTTQANDGQGKGWVLGQQFPLQKKGAGRGLHESGIICSTVGYLKEGSQTLEYGKNYDGYWTGELFIKQVSPYLMNLTPPLIFYYQLCKRLIPAFEVAHSTGHQALFLIDNLQGHSAYSEDALLVSRMNVKPGGKQAWMRSGWFIHDGRKVIQDMIFLPDYLQYPNEPKGIKAVLLE